MNCTSPTRVLILTDSLSLPRRYKKSIIKYEDTYVEMLKKENPNIQFIHVGIGGATITRLHQLAKYYVFSNPHYVILQCGIVDCAPRSLSEFELLLFGKLRLLRLIFPFTKILRKIRKISYTSPTLFQKTLKDIKNEFKDAKIVSIGILPGQPDYEKILPGVTRNINDYNKILESCEIYIDNSDFPLDGIIEDYHHLSKEGHVEIFHRIQKLIDNKTMH